MLSGQPTSRLPQVPADVGLDAASRLFSGSRRLNDAWKAHDPGGDWAGDCLRGSIPDGASPISPRPAGNGKPLRTTAGPWSPARELQFSGHSQSQSDSRPAGQMEGNSEGAGYKFGSLWQTIVCLNYIDEKLTTAAEQSKHEPNNTFFKQAVTLGHAKLKKY